MAKFRNITPHDLDVSDDAGIWTRVPAGGTLDVTGSTAKSLAEQANAPDSNWAVVKSEKSTDK